MIMELMDNGVDLATQCNLPAAGCLLTAEMQFDT